MVVTVLLIIFSVKISVAEKFLQRWWVARRCKVCACGFYVGDFLSDKFVLFLSHIMSEYARMTDTERDQIDQDAQVFMRTCADAIHQLRTEGKLSSSYTFSF